jgi:hypothetical protein
MTSLGSTLRQHRASVVALSLGLQALNGVLFSHHLIASVSDSTARGTSPGVAVGVAVLTALAVGPWLGALSAAAAWGIFYGLIVYKPTTIVALPVWVLAAYAAGMVSRRLVAAEREAARMHLARTPLATVVGLLRTVDDERIPAATPAVIAAALDEAEHALAAFDETGERSAPEAPFRSASEQRT